MSCEYFIDAPYVAFVARRRYGGQLFRGHTRDVRAYVPLACSVKPSGSCHAGFAMRVFGFSTKPFFTPYVLSLCSRKIKKKYKLNLM